MAIREVLTSFTFEQQRLMINLIGTDVGDASTLLTPTNVVVPAINEIVNGDVDLINQTHGMDPGSLASPSLYWGTNQGFFLVDANKIGLSTGLAIAGNLEVDGDITFRAGAGAGGTLTFGDLNTDNIIFNADVQSSIVPDTTANYNLGSLAKQWNNLWIDGTASIDTLTVDENSQFIGYIAVGSGDIRVPSTQTTVDLFDDYATTVEAFGDATDIRIGDTTGTLTLRNPTIVGSEATQNLFNTVATQVNAFGAATTINMGVSGGGGNSNLNILSDDTVCSGDLAINGGELLSSQTTFDLLINNDNINIGNTTGQGTTTINNRLQINGNLAIGGTSTYIELPDNQTNAFRFREGSNDYLQFRTEDGLERIVVWKDLYVVGNLDISGTTTTIDSTTLVVEDKNIELGNVTTPSDTTADGGGITLKATTDKTITYNNTSGRWETNIGLNVDGTVTGKQTSNNALSAFEAVDTNGTRFKVTGAGVLSIYDNTLTENVNISSSGDALFAGMLQTSNSVRVGGTLPNTPNIKLNSGGSAEFAGDVTAGNATATGVGVVVRESGSVVTRVDTVDPVFQAFSGGNTGADKKIEFIADGSANFASTLSTGSLDIAAAGGQGSTITGDGRLTLQFPSGGGSGVGMLSIYSGTTKTIEFFSGGFASFGANVDVGTSSATSDSDHTIDAGLYGMYSITASFSTTRSVNISNLTDGRKVIVHMRNTNGSVRTINILASTTTSGFASVNMMNSPGGPSVTAGQIAANSGTLFMTIANINGTLCGHFG